MKFNQQFELDSYLDDQKLHPSVGFDIFTYWKEKCSRCLNLARMTYDILSIPITTVASESAFSIDSWVLNKYRCSMKEESVQAFVYKRSWLYDFEGKLVKFSQVYKYCCMVIWFLKCINLLYGFIM